MRRSSSCEVGDEDKVLTAWYCLLVDEVCREDRRLIRRRMRQFAVLTSTLTGESETYAGRVHHDLSITLA
jgi:hypothetical protein